LGGVGVRFLKKEKYAVTVYNIKIDICADVSHSKFY
jgi:hypothetical protein